MAWYNELGRSAFSQAFHSHLHELAYEDLKDPAYQEWMRDWLEGFFRMLWRDMREKRLKRERRKGRARATGR